LDKHQHQRTRFSNKDLCKQAQRKMRCLPCELASFELWDNVQMLRDANEVRNEKGTVNKKEWHSNV
jgi:hypothetical protein